MTSIGSGNSPGRSIRIPLTASIPTSRKPKARCEARSGSDAARRSGAGWQRKIEPSPLDGRPDHRQAFDAFLANSARPPWTLHKTAYATGWFAVKMRLTCETHIRADLNKTWNTVMSRVERLGSARSQTSIAPKKLLRAPPQELDYFAGVGPVTLAAWLGHTEPRPALA